MNKRSNSKRKEEEEEEEEIETMMDPSLLVVESYLIET